MFVGSAAYFKVEELDNAVNDADEAIKKTTDFAKAYVRKAVALREIDKFDEAINLIKTAPEKVKEDESVKVLLKELEDEFALDNVLPKDHPEILRFEKFLKWLKDGGAKFDKAKMRFYSADYRGVHAKMRVRKNEVLDLIPKNLIIT